MLGEMDVFCLRRSGYAEEFEIKISTSDLKADAKKVRKHMAYTDADTNIIPNKFSYVLGPDVKYDLTKMPERYGVYVVDGRYMRCMRSPKFLHKHKYNWDEKVAKSCSWRLLSKCLRIR
jgi:hypothetical protein